MSRIFCDLQTEPASVDHNAHANVPLAFPKIFISFTEHDIHLDIIISSDMQHALAYHEYVSSFYRLTAASN